MRVMQLVDSLDLGGAERMAVTYANMLCEDIEKSYLCVTRKEGALKETLDSGVLYHFLNKKKTIDRKAIKRVITLIKKENIDIIHAHGTSYFFAFLIKLHYKQIRIIWHNHYGASKEYSAVKFAIMKRCVRFFNAIIVVNQSLKEWTIKELSFSEERCHYISNFVKFGQKDTQTSIALVGRESQRVVCLANLKHPKEHLFLSKAFKKVHDTFPEATLHLVGNDYRDDYSAALKRFIKEHRLDNTIFIHGQQATPEAYLNACAIGVLASSSEGLPMALLEYGRSNLAVISTDVGQCNEVMGNSGLLVPNGDGKALAKALEKLLLDPDEQASRAREFTKHVRHNYSQETVRSKVLALYSSIWAK